MSLHARMGPSAMSLLPPDVIAQPDRACILYIGDCSRRVARTGDVVGSFAASSAPCAIRTDTTGFRRDGDAITFAAAGHRHVLLCHNEL